MVSENFSRGIEKMTENNFVTLSGSVTLASGIDAKTKSNLSTLHLHSAAFLARSAAKCEKEKEIIFGPVLYASIKEFQQDDKMARLDLQKEYVVEEKFFIVVMGIDDTGIDESNSYFKLETIRVRKGL